MNINENTIISIELYVDIIINHDSNIFNRELIKQQYIILIYIWSTFILETIMIKTIFYNINIYFKGKNNLNNMNNYCFYHDGLLEDREKYFK